MKPLAVFGRFSSLAIDLQVHQFRLLTVIEIDHSKFYKPTALRTAAFSAATRNSSSRADGVSSV